MESLAYSHHTDSYEASTQAASPFQKKASKTTKKKATVRMKTPATAKAAQSDLHAWVMPWMP